MEQSSNVRISRSEPLATFYIPFEGANPIIHYVNHIQGFKETSREISESSVLNKTPQLTSIGNSQINAKSPLSGCSSSVSKDQCRICYQTASENIQDGELLACGCICSGTAKFAHKGCLQEWIHVSGTNQCEICGVDMALSVEETASFKPRIKRDGNGTVVNIPDRNLRRINIGIGSSERRNLITINDHRAINTPRCWMVTIFVLMVLATASSASFMVYAHRNLKVQNNLAISHGLPQPKLEELHMSYGLSLAIFVFCGTLTFSVGMVWFCSEIHIFPKSNRQERGRYNSQRAPEIAVHTRNVTMQV